MPHAAHGCKTRFPVTGLVATRRCASATCPSGRPRSRTGRLPPTLIDVMPVGIFDLELIRVAKAVDGCGLHDVAPFVAVHRLRCGRSPPSDQQRTAQVPVPAPRPPSPRRAFPHPAGGVRAASSYASMATMTLVASSTPTTHSALLEKSNSHMSLTSFHRSAKTD